MAENAKPELRRNKVLTAWVRGNGGINTVAGALGVSPQAVSHWCTGRRRMSHKAAAAIVLLSDGEVKLVDIFPELKESIAA